MLQLINCYESLDWKYLSCKANISSAVPKRALIAPSRNLLNAEAFSLRQLPFPIDEKVQKQVLERGLGLPELLYPPLPMTDHCLAMSLHFTKKFRETKSIQAAAQSMQGGVDLECARTTALYSHLFDFNQMAAHQAQVPLTELVSVMRETTTNALDLSITQEITLRRPLAEMLPYIQSELVAGEYLIPLTNHVVTLVKDEKGKLVLFDPNYGTIDLTTTEGQKFCSSLFEKNKIHLSETLSLLKVSDYQPDPKFQPQKIEVGSKEKSSEEKPELTFEKGKDRWGVAKFTWRGKTLTMPWDSKTGLIYNNDSPRLLRFKCALLVFRTSVDTALRSIYHVGCAALKALSLAFVWLAGKEAFSRQVKSLKKSAEDIFRAPAYGALLTAAAIYGVQKPLDGRRLFGYFERCLNRQNHHMDLREKYYIAPCFKPWNFGVQADEDATIKELQRIFLHLQYMHSTPVVELFCGWRKALPCCR